ncbi:MAG TPA: alpha/beta fold hydrolase [Acidobacteriaceae bacterium]|nr:alpha/beta fold hydrolase [Acidobacteriaceae bacterium]
MTVEGARVHYVRAGSGRPLLLIHGIVGSAMIWRRNIPALTAHATVYALDLVGMGKSERVPGLAPGLEETAGRVLATMDALGVAQADVGAASHGGAVAMTMAALAPGRVRSLILFAPANPYSTAADWLVRAYSSRLGAVVAAIAPRLPRWVHQIALGRMFGDRARIPEGCLDPYREALRVPGTMRHVRGIVRTWFADMEKLRIMLPQVAKTPTLLLWGDKDRAVSLESGRRLERELGAELVVFPGGGHLIFEEFADEVNRVMVEWLRRTGDG